jgi:hypothetical protein
MVLENPKQSLTMLLTVRFEFHAAPLHQLTTIFWCETHAQKIDSQQFPNVTIGLCWVCVGIDSYIDSPSHPTDTNVDTQRLSPGENQNQSNHAPIARSDGALVPATTLWACDCKNHHWLVVQ